MDRFTELLVALHEGLPRLGPGDADSTLRALALCDDLAAAPHVLDVGCGTGAQSLILASATDGRILATDLMGAFLTRLEERAAETGFEQRIRTCRSDMSALPFADGSFDLVWSEGAAYIIGFDTALTRWRPLVRPRGYLVISEMSWFRPDPPAELREFWGANYPAMSGIDENLAAACDRGWTRVESFHLPVAAWTDGYYGPLKARVPAFRRAHEGDPDAQAVADMTEHEMSLMSRYADFCGYAFYVLRRAEGDSPANSFSPAGSPSR